MDSSGIVNILSPSKKSIGTGFFCSPEGYILTCKHVLEDAGYVLQRKVLYKYAGSSDVYEAKWIENDTKTDTSILQGAHNSGKYLPLIHRGVFASAESFGFPNGSTRKLKASLTVECLLDDGDYLQLGSANRVTFGFSGAPVIQNGSVIGMVSNTARTDSNQRMLDVAFAIPAEKLIKSFSKYIKKKDVCVGYGEKENKCLNYPISDEIIMCKECYAAQYIDEVKALYEAQNYFIHECDGFFIANLKYGVSNYYDAIFTFVKINQKLTKNDLSKVMNKVRDNEFTLSQIIVVTNGSISQSVLREAHRNRIIVRTKDELLRELFDFNPYLEDLQAKANSEQLAGHYIKIYGTDCLRSNKAMVSYNQETEEEDGYDLYFESDLDEFLDDEVVQREVAEDLCDDDHRIEEGSFKQPKMLLSEYVDNFLTSKHQALLILGEYGSGKTSFCYTYALGMLNKFLQQKSIYFPLLIKLRKYNKAIGIGQLLTDYFVNMLGISNFNIASFKLMLSYLNVVLIFDGYDEVAKKVDFNVKYDVLKEICELAGGKTKITLTCRPNYFQSGEEFCRIFKNSYYAYEPGEQPIPTFIENSIADLTPTQIKEYIDSYQTELSQYNISLEEMLDSIANTHDLTDLSKRPFLLYMILSTLPKMLSKNKMQKIKEINAASLYEEYTNTWILREDQKNKTLIRQADKKLFCKELAYELYCSDSDALAYTDFPATIKNHFKYIERIEDIDYFSHDIQSCSFLTSDRSGEFKFIHKSFMEYFVADRIVQRLNAVFSKKKSYESQKEEVNVVLGKTYFSREVCLFINDMTKLPNSTESQSKALNMFAETNEIAQSNLLSLVAKTKSNIGIYFERFEISEAVARHADFSHAQFQNLTIKDLSFRGQHFFSTSFMHMTFVNCDFSHTSFELVECSDVKFYGCSFSGTHWYKRTKLINCYFSEEMPELLDSKLLQHFEIDTLDELDMMWGNFHFNDSIWEDVAIVGCVFIGGGFFDAKMRSIKIERCCFDHTDFSGLEILGKYDIKNNEFIETSGTPYEFD